MGAIDHRTSEPPDLMLGLLGLLARHFGADPASFLTEVNSALELRRAVHLGYEPRRKSVTPPSRAVLAFAEVTDEAARHFLALGNPAQSPNALPAGLGIPGGEVGAGSLMAALSEADEITSGEAARLLGVSAERVRQLARKREIPGWQDGDGRHEWHLARADVVAWRERSGHDPGGTARCA